jgi:hypothetical protein
MSWLKAVSVLALRVRALLGTVRLMQAVGPASLEHTAPHGNKPSALHTNHQHHPALTPQSPSSDHALLISTGQKLGSERRTVSVDQVLTAAGSKSQIPARQRLQLAKQARRHVMTVASQIKLAAKSSPVKTPAQTHMDSQSLVRGH